MSGMSGGKCVRGRCCAVWRMFCWNRFDLNGGWRGGVYKMPHWQLLFAGDGDVHILRARQE